jgi:hypothetical protein
MDFKLFSSGSQGYYRQRKVRTGNGVRYQAQVTAVLIGSKRNMASDVRATRDDVAFEMSAIIATLEAKEFRTGRIGYYASGKITVGGERFQVGMQAVRILDS